MAIQPLQLPPTINLPQLNFAPLGEIGDAVAGYRQRGALADALPGMLGNDPAAPAQGGVPAAPAQGGVPAAPAQGSGVPLTALGKPQAGLDPKAIYSGLIQRGLAPTAAAGITGNLHGESGLNPTNVGDGGTAFGLAQWRGDRLNGLKAFAAQNGKDISDPNVQLDYLVSELKGPEARAFSGLQAAQTPADAATSFMTQYMRPAAWAAAQSGPTRAAVANQVYQQGAPAPPAGQGAPSAAQPGQTAAPQGAPGAPPAPAIPPATMARLQAMIRAGGSAQQFAMAMLQKYIVPQTPVVIGEGGVAINPITGAIIGRGQQKPVVVNEGGIAFNPDTGAAIARGQSKSYPVAAGGSLVTPGQAGQGAGAVYTNDSGKLDNATLDGMARRYLETGDNQIISDAGNGTLGAISRAALMNRIETLRAQSGKSGADIVGAKGDSANQVKSIEAFGSGPQGNTVRSLNVAVDHLALLRELAQEMTQGAGITGFRPSNAIVNAFKKEFGYDMPTNVEAARHIVAAELTKAVTGSQGALGDRESLTAPLQTANSWEQLSGIIDKTYTPLMAGQLRGLRQQYVVNTKKDGESFDAMLSDRTKSALKPTQQAAPPTAQAQPPSQETQAQTFSTPQEAYAAMKAGKLKSGDKFMTPDGQLRIAK